MYTCHQQIGFGTHTCHQQIGFGTHTCHQQIGYGIHTCHQQIGFGIHACHHQVGFGIYASRRQMLVTWFCFAGRPCADDGEGARDAPDYRARVWFAWRVPISEHAPARVLSATQRWDPPGARCALCQLPHAVLADGRSARRS
eukprot:1187240-Prorocentrum_minimum.AAC.1